MGLRVESRSHHDFLFLHDAWATCDRLMSYEITSAISIVSILPLNPGECGFFFIYCSVYLNRSTQDWHSRVPSGQVSLGRGRLECTNVMWTDLATANSGLTGPTSCQMSTFPPLFSSRTTLDLTNRVNRDEVCAGCLPVHGAPWREPRRGVPLGSSAPWRRMSDAHDCRRSIALRQRPTAPSEPRSV